MLQYPTIPLQESTNVHTEAHPAFPKGAWT